MKTKLNPYITFKGNARQAMEFYKSVFGGKLDMNTFKDSGMPTDPGAENQLMHAMLVTDNDMTIMASDVPDIAGIDYKVGSNFSISLSGDNEEELTGYFNGLATGGTIREPLKKAPWGDTFGMVTDKFGIMWMVNITGKKTNG